MTSSLTTLMAATDGVGDAFQPIGLMTTKQAASYLGIGKSTLEQSRVSGINCPPYIKLGANVRYRMEDLKAFVAERVRTSTAQAA